MKTQGMRLVANLELVYYSEVYSARFFTLNTWSTANGQYLLPVQPQPPLSSGSVSVLLCAGQGSGQHPYSLHTSLLLQSVDARGQCCLVTSLHRQEAISGNKAAENLLLFFSLNLFLNK